MLFSSLSTLLELFEQYGDISFRDGVSHREHALQAGQRAKDNGLDSALVTASLLQNIGYLVRYAQGESETSPRETASLEALGVQTLSKIFGPQVTEPIRLQPVAKKYWLAVETDEEHPLLQSEESSLSTEFERFYRHPYFERAVLLARFHKRAATPGKAVHSFHYFLGDLKRCMRQA